VTHDQSPKPLDPTFATASSQSTVTQAALPSAWINARDQQSNLWSSLASGQRSLLICDYDGTLAPFKADKMTAVPYPGIEERLEKIAALPRTELALVSGRPVAELITLFPLAGRLDLYGSHGREFRSAHGEYRLEPVDETVRNALDAAAEDLTRAGYGHTLERKAASLAVHWRNLSHFEQATLADLARDIFSRNTRAGALAVLPFESGIELRTSDYTKAQAVEDLLRKSPGGYPVAAYLGDDATDEDAFGALGSRGLSLLVREQARPSLANYWLRPPAQLLCFLDDWLRAAARNT
jgi:trehalose-phosphatase